MHQPHLPLTIADPREGRGGCSQCLFVSALKILPYHINMVVQSISGKKNTCKKIMAQT